VQTVRSWALIGTKDLIIPPAAQRFMAERAGARISTVNAGHLALVSQPGAVADFITKVARQTTP
jgi:pimeloyl-ACP methyl ester carboxylesterase